jgi:hypothetical protein
MCEHAALLLLLTLCCTLQTVPTCPALYKNTFTYHTVELAPPEFEECFTFLGKCGMLAVLARSRTPGVIIIISLQETHQTTSNCTVLSTTPTCVVYFEHVM